MTRQALDDDPRYQGRGMLPLQRWPVSTIGDFGPGWTLSTHARVQYHQRSPTTPIGFEPIALLVGPYKKWK